MGLATMNVSELMAALNRGFASMKSSMSRTGLSLNPQTTVERSRDISFLPLISSVVEISLLSNIPLRHLEKSPSGSERTM